MKLIISKNNTYVFELIKATDNNANTYTSFIGGYKVSKGKRIHFSTDKISGWNEFEGFYSYANAYDDVKEWINKNTNLSIKYISDYPNVIAFSSKISMKEFNRLTKN